MSVPRSYCEWITYTARKKRKKMFKGQMKFPLWLKFLLHFVYTLKLKSAIVYNKPLILFPSWNTIGAPGHPGPKGDAGEPIAAPEVIVSPTSLTVTQYQTAKFYCSADGNPKPSVSWTKISGSGLVNTDGKGNKLQIKSAGYNDSGNYVCTATNVFGRAKKVVKLFVQGSQLFYCDVR